MPIILQLTFTISTTLSISSEARMVAAPFMGAIKRRRKACGYQEIIENNYLNLLIQKGDEEVVLDAG